MNHPYRVTPRGSRVATMTWAGDRGPNPKECPTLTPTAVAPAPDIAERKDLREILTKLADVGSVELKMNVPPDQRMSLRSLHLDPLKGKLREVVFFDTPDL